MSTIILRYKRILASEVQSKNLQSIIFYVAPNGNDAWSGQQESPNSQNTDGPFATLQRVRDAIRQLKKKQDGTLKQQILVIVRGGTYFLTQPLVFTPEDSDTPFSPITYKAYPGEKPVISDGRRITTW